MKNPCGTTTAKILESYLEQGIPVYFGTAVNPVNSPAQFFVAWGVEVLKDGLVRTFNCEELDQGFLWFVDEDEALEKYSTLRTTLGT